MEQLVSVIIPNYNHAQYLKKRIDSVINQTYQKIEVIILDDYSDDNSREIIESFKGHPLVRHIVYNESNAGSPFKQWKKGIDLAKGEWIWIAESDDYADIYFLDKLISNIPKHENIGLIYCDSFEVDDNYVVKKKFADIKNLKHHTDHWSSDYMNQGTKEILEYILPGGTINNTSAVLFNRKVLGGVDIFDYPFRYMGDKYAFIKVLTNTSVKYVNEPLNFYRNPFSGKHDTVSIQYVKEQFIIFSYVRKSIGIDSNFYRIFILNTEISLFKIWRKEYLSILKELFICDLLLFFMLVIYNFIRPLLKAFGLSLKNT